MDCGYNPAHMLRTLAKSALLMAALVFLGLAVRHLGLDSLNEQWIDTTVRGQGLRGEIIFIVMGMLAMAVGLPRQVFAFLGGYAFGFVSGTALALLATVLGCIASFYYARVLARDLMKRRFAQRIAQVDVFLGRSPFNMALVIRLLPVGSNLLTNLIAGLSHTAALPFFAGSALGFLPQTLIFALAGSGVNVDPSLRLSIAAALFIVSAIIGAHLYRQHRQAAQFESALAQNDPDQPHA
jgi:uncharacterized membrane protein YdjX (TVP38/TMEM64 family)